VITDVASTNEGNTHAGEASSMHRLTGRTLIFGHRGSPRQRTENTLTSFTLTVQQGADGVELDVRQSRDGTPVVIHDATLDRTAGASGRVSELPWQAIARLTNGRVPSLEQTNAWAAASGAWLNVELKTQGLEALALDLARRAGTEDWTIFSSFNPTVVEVMAQLAPSIPPFLLTESWDETIRGLTVQLPAGGICLSVAAADDAAVEEIGEIGLPLIVWTVNDPAHIRRLIQAGIAAIITDDPEMAVRERLALERSAGEVA